MATVIDRLLFVFLEPSTALLLLGVLLLLTHSAYRSQCFSSSFQAQLAQEAEASPVTLLAAVLIPVVGSVMLVVLFYFLHLMFYVLVVLLGVGSLLSSTLFFRPMVSWCRAALFPRLSAVQTIKLRGTVYREPFVDVGVAGLCAAAVVALWLFTKHWLWVDVLAVALASEAVSTLRLPNLMVSTVLLSVFFVYDIFWVFLSPLLFGGTSVMVEVAVGVTGGSVPLPMLVLVPKFFSSGAGMLGLGDIVLPGLLLSHLFRIDYSNVKKRLRESGQQRQLSPFEVLAAPGAYFAPCLLGYGVGLVLTFAALAILQIGQPALLYLVPCTLGPALILTARSGQLRHLWTLPKKASAAEDIEMQEIEDENVVDEN